MSKSLKVNDLLPDFINSGPSFALVQHNRMTIDLNLEASKQGFEIVDTIAKLDVLKNPSPKRDIFVLTSGTTGLPKFIRHDDNSLNTFAKVQNIQRLTWFVPAPLGSFAWYQMIYLSLCVPGQDLLIPEPEEVGSDFQRHTREKSVTGISCTPTFLKYMVLSYGLESCLNYEMKVVTLGGEIATEQDLSLAKRLFPNARVTQVYAISEVGPIFMSNDGHEGFPLGKYRRGIDFELYKGELLVPQTQIEETKTWYHTGDLARIVNGRIVIEGRLDTDFVNVGGNRVSLRKIEGITESHPSIVWAKAKATPSKFMGNLVVVETVINDHRDAIVIEEELNSIYLSELNEYEIPTRIEFIGSAPVNRNLKK